ncbi:MAG: tail fiber protein [Byssovorax sp.]
MSQPFIGEVRAVSWNLVPRGWAFCNGQLLSIAQNQALFAILGTTYGGDGITTFALPNLKGRVPVGAGQNVALGESAGVEQVTLITPQIPAHTHGLMASTAAGSEDPLDKGPAGAKAYGPAAGLAPMAPSTLSATGGSQPHDNMAPSLTISYIIALQGIFPSRS